MHSTYTGIRGPRHGNMMLVNVVVVMLLALLFAFMLNSGRTLVRKTEGQTAADAAAWSATLQKEIAMNQITAANHVSGETLGLIITHHGLGGDLLDENKRAEDNDVFVWKGSTKINLRRKLNRANSDLENAQAAADRLGAHTRAFRKVRQRQGVFAEATILESKITLKELLAFCYWNKAAAKAMQLYPPTRPAGEALEKAMDAFEVIIRKEYEILNAFQTAAEQTRDFKFELRDTVLAELKHYADEVVQTTPDIVREMANEIAVANGAESAFVVDAELPVEVDPLATATALPQTIGRPEPHPQCCACQSIRTSVTRDQIVKVTQLSRSAFPFVTYHRKPIWDILETLPLSKAGKHYKDYSDGASKQLSNRFQVTGVGETQRTQLGQYVIRDYAAPDKGYGLWTDDPEKADRHFGTLVSVYVPQPSVIGPTVFGQNHPNGQLFFAQGRIYNANPQERNPRRIDLRCKRITPNMQANVGYDTLNWNVQVAELIAKTDAGGAPPDYFPQIQLNWQVNLMPATANQLRRLKSAPLPSSHQRVVNQMLEETPSALLTH